ncbi:Cysteine protease [Phytophthora megakarya]|uniref:Cysteine protease n=1 Tax=Phytophthora megakarya TaxID=4795 RepID=A0A225ULS6_9STRA|nr:Cysteine protease [Phytophthora megakarya]
MGVQTPLREIIKKLKTWQSNPTWSAGKAAKELNTKKPTILAWKKKYWADLDRITDPGDRMRQPGGGRKHKMASFEWAVVEFYDSCLLQDGAN